MIERRDQRSMNTPVNGTMIENGSETIRVAIANPSAVLCSSTLKTTEATSAAWKSPSADWETSRIAKSRRKSWLRRASRARWRVDLTRRW